MRSAKPGPNLWQIWQVFGPWASPYGANGQITMTVHNYRPRQFHRTSNGENPSSGYRDMGSASLAAARPPARPPEPWRQYPSSPKGPSGPGFAERISLKLLDGFTPFKVMWMKTAKVSIQDKYLKTSFTKLSNIFSNLNEITRKIQQLPCKKMHLRFVCKMAVILCGPQYITCVHWLCLRQNSRHVSNWIVKKTQKLYKRKSIWKRR